MFEELKKTSALLKTQNNIWVLYGKSKSFKNIFNGIKVKHS